jgi:hypothetical protein
LAPIPTAFRLHFKTPRQRGCARQSATGESGRPLFTRDRHNAQEIAMGLLGRLPVLPLLLVVGFSAVEATNTTSPTTRIRAQDWRVRRVVAQGMTRSPSFRELVATLELLDRDVNLEHRPARTRADSGCAHGVPEAVNATSLLVRFDSRDPVDGAVSRAAHALYHALEIAREPDVVDEPGRRRLLSRIGTDACGDFGACCETRSAAAFEALVRRELSGLEPSR